MLDKYYAAKYLTATMTPDELAIFQAAINKLAGSTTVPTAEQEQQQGVTSAWHQQMLEQAARRPAAGLQLHPGSTTGD